MSQQQKQVKSKIKQINVRWSVTEYAALARIAAAENRSKSEIVRIFAQWGIEKTDALGSIQTVIDAQQNPAFATYRERMRELALETMRARLKNSGG